MTTITKNRRNTSLHLSDLSDTMKTEDLQFIKFSENFFDQFTLILFKKFLRKPT